jgi:hypothetical protein
VVIHHYIDLAGEDIDVDLYACLDVHHFLNEYIMLERKQKFITGILLHYYKVVVV